MHPEARCSRRSDHGRWAAALHSQSSSDSPDHNDPFHAGLIMTRQQAGELERSRLGETPQQLLAVGWLQARAVGLLMVHLGVLLHLGLVLCVVAERVDQE